MYKGKFVIQVNRPQYFVNELLTNDLILKNE